MPFKKGLPRPYPIAIWFVEDPEAPDEEPVIRWSRRGWHEGTFKYGGSTCTLIITERDSDGLFTKSDAWGLGETADQAFSPRNSTNSIGKHAWLDGVAFQVVDLDESGQFITIRAFDPGMTEEEDRLAKDPYAKDRTYERAAQPVRFSSDLEAALKEAERSDQRVLVDFVTTWCGPCKVMDDLVYTAKPVVEAANNNKTIFVKLDG